MTELKKICEEMISLSKDKLGASYKTRCNDLAYEISAANNADKLARACLIMEDALCLYENHPHPNQNSVSQYSAASEALAKVKSIFSQS